MYDIESILMALFGGGTADWNDIANTEYDWENIFELLKEKYLFQIRQHLTLIKRQAYG